MGGSFPMCRVSLYWLSLRAMNLTSPESVRSPPVAHSILNSWKAFENFSFGFQVMTVNWHVLFYRYSSFSLLSLLSPTTTSCKIALSILRQFCFDLFIWMPFVVKLYLFRQYLRRFISLLGILVAIYQWLCSNECVGSLCQSIAHYS